MKISYAITVCNEKKEVKQLVDFLLANKRQQDEIVVLYDQKNGDEEVINMLTKLNKLPNFNLEVMFTGNETETGGRIYKIRDRIESDTFIVSYGDCLADVDIDKLISFHRKHNKIATITVTRLHSRFGFVELDNNSIINSFREKEKEQQLYSIGFMVFNRKIFDYLDENIILEKEPFTNLVQDKEIVAYEHDGFFEPMDTYREYIKLNSLWESDSAPWV